MHQPYTPEDRDLETYIESWQTLGDLAYIHSLCQQIDSEPTPEAINDYLTKQGHKPRSVQRLATMLHERQQLIDEFYSPQRRPLMDEFPSPAAYEAAYQIHREEQKARRAARRTTRKEPPAKR